jgi:hypothetical protein
MLVKLIHSGIVTTGKYFRDMTAEEKTEATSRPWLFDPEDIFIRDGRSWLYHDSKDIEIIGG